MVASYFFGACSLPNIAHYIMHAIAYGFLTILACTSGLTVRLLSRTIRPCSSQAVSAVNYDAYDQLSLDHFFVFDCMVTYSAMHDRVLFVPAPLRYSCETAMQLSSFEPGQGKRNIVAMMCFRDVRHCSNAVQWPIGRAISW